MGKVRTLLSLIILNFLQLTYHSPNHFLKSVHLESGHINVGTKISFQEIVSALNNLKKTATRLKDDKTLEIRLKTQNDMRYGFDLLNSKFYTYGKNNLRSDVFSNIETRTIETLHLYQSICGRQKRWDVLGNLLNELTGVPSHAMHNQVVHELNDLTHDMDTLIQQGIFLTKEVKLSTSRSKAVSKELKSFNQALTENVKEIEMIEKNQLALFNIVNFESTANRLLEFANQHYFMISDILIMAKSHKSTQTAIAPEIIKNALDQMTDATLQPITEDTLKYYDMAIFRGTCTHKAVFVSGKIPLINREEVRNLTLLTTDQKRQAKVDLSQYAFKITNNYKNTHAYLTFSDMERCLDAENFFVCSKRSIELNNKQEGLVLAYDITPNRILIDAQGMLFAICSKNTENLILHKPIISIVPDECHLTHEHFHVHKTHLNENFKNHTVHLNLTLNYMTIKADIDHTKRLERLHEMDEHLDSLQDNFTEILRNISLLENWQTLTTKERDRQQEEKILHINIGLGMIATIGLLVITIIITLICILKNKNQTQTLIAFKNDVEKRLT